MEEWTNLRPNLAGVSAWTLNGCLKKYDGFKQQLIEEQEEARRQRELLLAPPPRVVTHPGTDVPVYRLEELGRYPKLPASVKQLVATRQAALLAAASSPLRYTELWAEQWLATTGERVAGWALQQRLHKLQAAPGLRSKLRRFVETRQVAPGAAEELPDGADPATLEREAPAIVARHSMFPRVPDPVSDLLIRRKHEEVEELLYDEENFVEVLGAGRLGLPTVLSVPDILEEDGIHFKSKMSYIDLEELNVDEVIQTKVEDSCQKSKGYQRFNNINNFGSYLELNRLADSRSFEMRDTFGQRMASHRLCHSIVSDCLQEALGASN